MIVIVGGSSRIGKALRSRLANREVVAFTRRDDDADAIQVARYADVAAQITPGSMVVNCVGTTRGSSGELMAINAALIGELACAADAAKARGFIHISSFSVYGIADRIDERTPERPLSDYGRSKLAADDMLSRLQNSGMSVSVLRLPALVAQPDDGKLGRLVRLAARLGRLPIPSPDIRRSMMTYADAAVVVESLIDRPIAGVSHAADPHPFSYGGLGEQWLHVVGKRLPLLRIPEFATAGARALLGQRGASVLGDSLLDPSTNLAEALTLPVGLAVAIRSTIAAETKRC